MKEHEMDDTIAMVLSDMRTSVPESFKAAIAGVRAPLASLIDELLCRQPGIRFREALTAIANLNQGRIQDLDNMAFRSYIIRKTAVSEDVLDKCILELSGFYRLATVEMTAGAELLMAARDEDGIGGGRISTVELLGQLDKRTK